MKLLKLLLTITLISTICFASSLRIVTEANYLKLINGDAGVEFLAKTSINLADSIDLKIGFSENYTAFRSSSYSMNHAGQRFDMGVYWAIANDFKVGYIHSVRSWFDGANPTSVFMNDSVDMLSIRKEFMVKF